MKNALNEENIKHIVLNTIQKWGFEANEINLEKSFTIRFGKGVVKVDTLVSATIACPRADILVKKDDKNLFIFEIKAENVKIDDNDIEQGLSYARLTKQITPFVVITNGKDTRVFKYDGKELNLNDDNFNINIKNYDYTLSLDIEENFYNATKYLIGMSSHNLSVFCQQQIDSRMETLRGNSIASDEKYIPELFIERGNVYNEFEQFLASEKTCFSIIGESGTGKTNVICDLAQKYASNLHPDNLSYFFSCHEMYSSIIENIKEDFNWHFTSQHSTDQIIKRISAISDKQTIIFFDAIDESLNDNFCVEFNDFIRKIKDYNIKICFTCKDIEYERFINNKGNPTIILKNVYGDKNGISLYLENFSEQEFDTIKSKYIEKYNLLEIPREIDYELRNGFILRIYAEIHKNKRKFQFKNILEMMDEYLKEKFSKMCTNKEDEEITYNILLEVSKYIWNSSIGKYINVLYDIYNMSDKISEQELNKNLQLRVTETIPHKLFEHKILQKVIYDEPLISFYYTRFRDYIIGFKLLKIDKLSIVDFKNMLPTLYLSKIGTSIIQWYYQFADTSHKKLIEDYFMSKILLFINKYNDLLNKYFKEIKNTLYPECIDKIAIAFLKNPVEPRYFLYPTKNSKDMVTIFDDSKKYNDTFHKLGGISSGLKINDENSMKSKAFIRLIEDVFRILKNPRHNGLGGSPEYYPNSYFDPKNNEIILNERTFNLFEVYSCLLGYKEENISKNGNYSYNRYKKNIFPILISDILDKINRLKIKIYLDGKNKIDFSNQTILIEPNNKIVQYNDVLIEQFIQTQKVIPNIKIAGIDILENYLIEYQKYSKTLDSPLPRADAEAKLPHIICESINGEIKERIDGSIIIDSYSKEQRNKYCQMLFYKMHIAYVKFVEEFFPTIKDMLFMYSNLPLLVEYNIKDIDDKKINNSLYCSFHYSILMKQQQETPIKMKYADILDDDYCGWMIMPLIESIEEYVTKKVSDEINKIYNNIAQNENIDLTGNSITIF